MYIDFEGTQVDPPSFLGVLWDDGGGTQCTQLLLEEGLWPAAAGKSESDWVSRRLLTLETRMEHGFNEAFPEAVSA